MSLIKALPTIFLRIFTVYDDLENNEAPESPPVSRATAPTTAQMIAARRRRFLGLTIPTLLWHGYQGEYVSTSWGIFTLYTMQVLGGVDAMGIETEAHALGSVLFSIINAACTLSTYALYFIAVLHSTASWLQAIVQLLLLLFPDAVGTGRNAQRVYATITDKKAALDVVMSGA